MDTLEHKNRRILLIDDNRSIHEDFMTILDRQKINNQKLAEAENAIFEQVDTALRSEHFEIDSAFQGQEGLDKIRDAIKEERPYAMAFVDVRMPPGWDGIETIRRIWQEYPQLQVVICTAYSDYDWGDIVAQLGQSDQLLILKKPFDNIEVYQLASALTEKWNDSQIADFKQEELERKVQEKTYQLLDANKKLNIAFREAMANNEQLNLLAQKAMAAKTAKDEFLGSMSHELRTPMNAIMGFSELLQMQELSGTPKKYVEIILKASKDLLRMIDNILDYVEISSGKFEPVTAVCPIAEILEQVSVVTKPEALAKGLEFDLKIAPDAPREIRTDAARLKQCLLNLIGNAIKFTEQGYIHISVSTDNNYKDCICFLVEDTGIGIPEGKGQAVLSPFAQADSSSTRRYGGTGLGLSITRQLAEFLGGKLLFTSTVGKGSVFTLIIPIMPSSLVAFEQE